MQSISHTCIKFCGMTQASDALTAAALGVDAIGLIFYTPSPRCVSIKQAQAIVAALPPFVTTVGVFVNASASELQDVMKAVPLDVLQFHGQEPASVCRSGQRPYIKSVAVRSVQDVQVAEKKYVDAQALLLDAYNPMAPGGTGRTFNWDYIPAQLVKPIILAGGLTINNVRQAIAQVQPYAVDVVSGIEVTKGIKDLSKMRDFVQQVRGFDSNFRY